MKPIWDSERQTISWVVVGSHSSPKQPFKMEWIDNVVDQCAEAGIPCYVKQIIKDGKLVKFPFNRDTLKD